MSWTPINVEKIPITRAVAVAHLQLPSVPGERKLGSLRLGWLRNEIASGKIRFFQWATATLPDGTVYRVNGQHSAYILANMNGDFPNGLYASLESYRAESIADAIDLWERLDPHLSQRTAAELDRTHADGAEWSKGFPTRAVSLIVGALSMENYGGGTNKVSRPNKLKLFSENREFSEAVLPFITKEDSIFRRVGVVWAMLCTWKQDGPASINFWQATESGCNSDPLSASRQLQLFLSSAMANRGRGRFLGGIVPTTDFRDICTRMYALHCAGKQVKKIHVPIARTRKNEKGE